LTNVPSGLNKTILSKTQVIKKKTLRLSVFAREIVRETGREIVGGAIQVPPGRRRCLGGMKMDNHLKYHAKGGLSNRQLVELKGALTIEKTGYWQFQF
jgi:hypothetical protein